jgi:toxin ParE1/3/4
MRFIWLPEAETSLNAHLDYIAEERPQAAAKQGERIAAAMKRLAIFPNSGRQGRLTGTRELVVPRTPFIVAYQVRDDTIIILRILHGAQPWPPRLP